MRKYPAFLTWERRINLAPSIFLNVPTTFEEVIEGSNVFRCNGAIVTKEIYILQMGINTPYNAECNEKQPFSYGRMDVKKFSPKQSMAKLKKRGESIENFVVQTNIFDLKIENENEIFKQIFEEIEKYFELYYSISSVSNEYVKYSDLKNERKIIYKNNINYYFLSEKEKNNSDKELEKVEIGFKKEVCDYNLYHLVGIDPGQKIFL
jgi:hypothetical protein